MLSASCVAGCQNVESNDGILFVNCVEDALWHLYPHYTQQEGSSLYYLYPFLKSTFTSAQLERHPDGMSQRSQTVTSLGQNPDEDGTQARVAQHLSGCEFRERPSPG